MTPQEKRTPLRIMMLITTPKLSQKAGDLLEKESVPVQYQWNAEGTAPSELIDILGLGSPDKKVSMSILPKPFADEMLKKLKKKLRSGAVDTGIAFTMPLTGVSNMFVHLAEPLDNQKDNAKDRKEETGMGEVTRADCGGDQSRLQRRSHGGRPRGRCRRRYGGAHPPDQQLRSAGVLGHEYAGRKRDAAHRSGAGR